jgi:hypothetical protein
MMRELILTAGWGVLPLEDATTAADPDDDLPIPAIDK